MTDLSVSKNFVCISNPKDTLVIPVDGNGDQLVIKHPEEKDSNKQPDDQPGEGSKASTSAENYDGGIPTVTTAFSPCGSFFACCSHKTLSLWNANNWTLISSKTIERSLSKMIFSPQGNAILVADKSGYVHIHYLHDFKEPGSLLLAHVSMLIDVLITKDQKHIITCDRDEKIRVSSFPDSYNIISYCLGHEEFVSSINILPKNPKTLLSSAGDGTFRLWDYLTGEELLCYDVRDNMSSVGGQPPVIYKVSLLETTDATIVCSLIFRRNAIWVHSIKESDTYSFEFLHFVPTHSAPYCLKSLNPISTLWALQLDSEEPIRALKLESNKLIKYIDAYVGRIQESVKIHMQGIDLDALQEKQINSLCKKKFDNEAAYFKRKSERLAAENAKRLAK